MVKDQTHCISKAATETLLTFKDKIKDKIDDEEIEDIIRQLKGKDPEVLWLAVLKISLFKEIVKERLNTGDVQRIASLLGAQQLPIRKMAAKALEGLEDKIDDAAVQKIVTLLRDKESDVRRAAIKILSKLKERVDDEAIKEILARLRDEKWGYKLSCYRVAFCVQRVDSE